jgi:hypothetical protein
MIFTPDPNDDYYMCTATMGVRPLQFSKMKGRRRVARFEVSPSFMGAYSVGHREGIVQANGAYVAVDSVGVASHLWPLETPPKQKP